MLTWTRQDSLLVDAQPLVSSSCLDYIMFTCWSRISSPAAIMSELQWLCYLLISPKLFSYIWIDKLSSTQIKTPCSTITLWYIVWRVIPHLKNLNHHHHNFTILILLTCYNNTPMHHSWILHFQSLLVARYTSTFVHIKLIQRIW